MKRILLSEVAKPTKPESRSKFKNSSSNYFADLFLRYILDIRIFLHVF